MKNSTTKKLKRILSEKIEDGVSGKFKVNRKSVHFKYADDSYIRAWDTPKKTYISLFVDGREIGLGHISKKLKK